jgi:hypothetical protein
MGRDWARPRPPVMLFPPQLPGIFALAPHHLAHAKAAARAAQPPASHALAHLSPARAARGCRRRGRRPRPSSGCQARRACEISPPPAAAGSRAAHPTACRAGRRTGLGPSHPCCCQTPALGARRPGWSRGSASDARCTPAGRGRGRGGGVGDGEFACISTVRAQRVCACACAAGARTRSSSRAPPRLGVTARAAGIVGH